MSKTKIHTTSQEINELSSIGFSKSMRNDLNNFITIIIVKKYSIPNL